MNHNIALALSMLFAARARRGRQSPEVIARLDQYELERLQEEWRARYHPTRAARLESLRSANAVHEARTTRKAAQKARVAARKAGRK